MMTTLSVKYAGKAIDFNKWERNNEDSQSLSTIFDQSKLKAFKEHLVFIRDDPYYFSAIIITSVAVFFFILTYLMSIHLKTQIQRESSSLGQKASSLAAGAVSAERLRTAHDLLPILEKDADEIRVLAIQTTQRELLSYDVFPEPDPTASFSTLVFQLFGQRFRDGIEGLIASVNGGDCLTEAEVNQDLENSLLRTRSGGSVRTGSSRREPIRNVSGRNMSRVEREVVDEIRKERAKSVSVYINPDDLGGYKYWADNKYEGKERAITDSWYHQLSYWVIEDVFDTIASMNSNYDNVLTAPVKRLQNITFNMGIKKSKASGRVHTGFQRRIQRKESGADRPAYVSSAKDGLTESCTGRYCDENIDVIHFSASFLISPEAVLPFMKELCTGKEHKFSGFTGNEAERRFKHKQITILESSIKPINPKEGSHRLYRYGNQAVVELSLVCEYIFYKKGYDEVKPKILKQELRAT